MHTNAYRWSYPKNRRCWIYAYPKSARPYRRHTYASCILREQRSMIETGLVLTGCQVSASLRTLNTYQIQLYAIGGGRAYGSCLSENVLFRQSSAYGSLRSLEQFTPPSKTVSPRASVRIVADGAGIYSKYQTGRIKSRGSLLERFWHAQRYKQKCLQHTRNWARSSYTRSHGALVDAAEYNGSKRIVPFSNSFRNC